MKPFILAFSGHIGSGKSTTSKAVAEELDWPQVSCGDVVRSVAQQQGHPESRHILQEIGAALVRDQLEAFCQLVLSTGGWENGRPLVIDGIRHSTVLNKIRCMVAPTPLFLVYLAADEETRKIRLTARKAERLPEVNQATDGESGKPHSTERQVEVEIPAAADITVDGSQQIHIIVHQILEGITALANVIAVDASKAV